MTTSGVNLSSCVRSGLAALALTVVLLGLTAVRAPVARAGDPVDDQFLAALKAKGINYQSGQAAIVAGHEVCDELDLGRQQSDVANDVMKNSNLDAYKAGYFVGASIAAYCPRFRS